MRIVKLTERYLKEAVKVVCGHFIAEEEIERPDLEIPASLYPAKYKEFLKKTGFSELRYWIGIEKGKVVGVIGLNSYPKDEKEADWLGWFTVPKQLRNEGRGCELLQAVIKQAKRRGKKFLRSYVVPDENGDARQFVENRGFKLLRTEPWKNDSSYTTYFYQLTL